MSKRYPKQPDTQPEVGLVNLACCDCGMVHRMGFTVEPDGTLRLRYARDKRATAQLRRGTFAFLKTPRKGDRWKMVRVTGV